jgi:hypothetical protein
MTCREGRSSRDLSIQSNFCSPLIGQRGSREPLQHSRLISVSRSSEQRDPTIASRHAPAATCQLRAAFSATKYKSVTIQLYITLFREQAHLLGHRRPARTSAVSPTSSASSDRCPSTPNGPARGCAQSWLSGRNTDLIAGLLEPRLGLARVLRAGVCVPPNPSLSSFAHMSPFEI